MKKKIDTKKVINTAEEGNLNIIYKAYVTGNDYLKEIKNKNEKKIKQLIVHENWKKYRQAFKQSGVFFSRPYRKYYDDLLWRPTSEAPNYYNLKKGDIDITVFKERIKELYITRPVKTSVKRLVAQFGLSPLYTKILDYFIQENWEEQRNKYDRIIYAEKFIENEEDIDNIKRLVMANAMSLLKAYYDYLEGKPRIIQENIILPDGTVSQVNSIFKPDLKTKDLIDLYRIGKDVVNNILVQQNIDRKPDSIENLSEEEINKGLIDAFNTIKYITGEQDVCIDEIKKEETRVIEYDSGIEREEGQDNSVSE